MKGWKEIIGTVAPTLATALGGPLAGAATQAISAALLGKNDGTEDEIAAAFATGGADALQKARDADAAFKVRMRELDIDLEKIAQQDRESARERESKTGDSLTLRALAALIVGSFIAVVWQVLFGDGSRIDTVLAGTLIGYLSAKADQVIGYYFGSSASSARKDDLLHKSVPADAGKVR